MLGLEAGVTPLHQRRAEQSSGGAEWTPPGMKTAPRRAMQKLYNSCAYDVDFKRFADELEETSHDYDNARPHFVERCD